VSIQSNIVIWGKKDCPYCEQVKTYLNSHGREFKLIDVEGNDSYRDILEVKYGVRRVPVTEVGEGSKYEAVIGPDLAKLGQVLAIS
jgi:glutaredoxin